MSTYTPRLTSFEAGVNIYTGTVQGGHTYASIRDEDWNLVTEITKPVDEAYLAELAALDPTDTSYTVGDDTARLSSRDEAITLAQQWMRDNAPDCVLAHERKDSTFYYTPPAGADTSDRITS